MKDQAQKLRDLIKRSRVLREGSEGKKLTGEKKDARVIAITSGKGGVGKTNITVNLALALSELGKRTTIIDADLGLANVDVVLGMIPKYNLFHLIKEGKTLDEITMIGANGIKVISGGSGMMDLVNLNDDELSELITNLNTLNKTADYILIDTGAGLNKSVLSFVEAANEVIVVVTPDPTSITDAYAVIKNIISEKKSIKIIVNQSDSSKESVEVFNKLHSVADKFLKIDLEYLGFVLTDSNVKKSVRIQTPYYIAYPNTAASKAIDMIAHHIENIDSTQNNISFGEFLRKLFSFE